MAINSYKQDENINDVGKLKTLGRLFSYLLAHKASIVVVLLIMAYCVCVSLVNPLIKIGRASCRERVYVLV